MLDNTKKLRTGVAEMMSRDIPVTREIHKFYHCRNCIEDKPDGTSPREWVSIEFGETALGFQVWCKRCDRNVAHIDLVGQKVRAAWTAVDPDDHVEGVLRAWLANNPRVKVGADLILDFAYDVADSNDEARREVGNLLGATEHWHRANTDAVIDGFEAWVKAVVEAEQEAIEAQLAKRTAAE